jgi:hypothetical protein
LGYTLQWRMIYSDTTFFNLPEGVTTDHADSLIADLCPAECSEVVSRVSPQCYKYNHAVCGN